MRHHIDDTPELIWSRTSWPVRGLAAIHRVLDTAGPEGVDGTLGNRGNVTADIADGADPESRLCHLPRPRETPALPLFQRMALR